MAHPRFPLRTPAEPLRNSGQSHPRAIPSQPPPRILSEIQGETDAAGARAETQVGIGALERVIRQGALEGIVVTFQANKAVLADDHQGDSDPGNHCAGHITAERNHSRSDSDFPSVIRESEQGKHHPAEEERRCRDRRAGDHEATANPELTACLEISPAVNICPEQGFSPRAVDEQAGGIIKTPVLERDAPGSGRSIRSDLSGHRAADEDEGGHGQY